METNDSYEEYNELPEFFCDTTDFKTVNGAAYVVIFIISVTFNTLLLFVLLRYEKVKSITDLFVLNLTCSDLVFTVTLVFWAVQELHQWVFGDFACKFLIGMYFAGEYSSVMLLTAMTVDRFKTVVLSKWTNRARRQMCAKVACVSAWVVGIAGSLVDAFKGDVKEFNCGSSYSEALSFYLQVSLLFFLPFVIIVICYAAILKKVLQPSNRKKTRTVVAVLVIVVIFFLCWGPYNILLLLEGLYESPSCDEEQRWIIAHLVFRLLAYAHCFMNPLLYMQSQKLQGHLWRLLHCNKVRGRSRERSTTVTVTQNAAYCAQNSSGMLQ